MQYPYPVPSGARSVFASDLTIGDTYDIGSHTVTEADIIDFATKWDPQFFHTDRHAAASGYFGGIIASGLHTLAIFQRLAVTHCLHDWNVIAGTGLRELRFPRPVRPGDILAGSIAITDIEVADHRPGTRVTIQASLVNQHTETVLTATNSLYMDADRHAARRPHSA